MYSTGYYGNRYDLVDIHSESLNEMLYLLLYYNTRLKMCEYTSKKCTNITISWILVAR